MVLGFKTGNKGVPTLFKEKVLAGEKIHSLRKGNRWKAGMAIQMATGVRTKQYNAFNLNRADLWICTGVQHISFKKDECVLGFEVYVDGKRLSGRKLQELIQNDGFKTMLDFYAWFKDEKDWPDQIVHWTDFRY